MSDTKMSGKALAAGKFLKNVRDQLKANATALISAAVTGKIDVREFANLEAA